MAKTIELILPGGMTKRGFWLYVWKVETEVGELHYVGRTGDNSSPYAASVYRRMGQHLGDADNTNALLNHLRKKFKDRDIWDFESFRMISHGPIFPEVERHVDFKHGEAPHYQDAFERHRPFRDRMASLEAHLAVTLDKGGYTVLNTFSRYAAPRPEDWMPVREAFAKHFPALTE